jgi:hypothetical protein
MIRQLVINDMKWTLAMLRAESRNEQHITTAMRECGYRPEQVKVHADDFTRLAQAVAFMEGALIVLQEIKS